MFLRLEERQASSDDSQREVVGKQIQLTRNFVVPALDAWANPRYREIKFRILPPQNTKRSPRRHTDQCVLGKKSNLVNETVINCMVYASYIFNSPKFSLPTRQPAPNVSGDKLETSV